MSKIVKVPTVRMSLMAKSRGEKIGPPSAYRDVFKCKTSRFVYKFPGGRYYDAIGANEREYATYLKILSSMILPQGVKVPEMHLLENGALAAEYIDGRHPDYNGCSGSGHESYRCKGEDRCWATKVILLGLRDMHYQNVIVTEDGTVYLIDLDGGFAKV